MSILSRVDAFEDIIKLFSNGNNPMLAIQLTGGEDMILNEDNNKSGWGLWDRCASFRIFDVDFR